MAAGRDKFELATAGPDKVEYTAAGRRLPAAGPDKVEQTATDPDKVEDWSDDGGLDKVKRATAGPDRVM